MSQPLWLASAGVYTPTPLYAVILVELAEELKLSEDHVEVHVEDALPTWEVKLQAPEAMMHSAQASSSGTSAATPPEGFVDVSTAQAYEIKTLTAAMQKIGEERVNVHAQLASLASRLCHCPDVEKLMADMTAAGAASTQAFKRIGGMELLRRQAWAQVHPWRV